YLVGAGPGDPELLTLKAARLLRSADAVLHDELVTPEILRLASASAQLHNVGKRCGGKKVAQEEINFLMVKLASAGSLVVRLKGGDPLLLGRAGEELAALRQAGVPYEIVPGVTAALGAAAAAAIPLTHREGPAALVLLAGHRAPHNEDAGWSELARSGATLAIYMPGHDYGELARRLRQAGMAAETPCALVSQATTPAQQARLATLADLPACPRLPAPALLIVGGVVALAGAENGCFGPLGLLPQWATLPQKEMTL
ncbi:MAG TPA: uroporphyrinogen-III C-methyltransferase, partial [Terriglobales bacterium]|nr:uroporphyrinogen-III C-methyltransferase [Terriglobales bacterium]